MPVMESAVDVDRPRTVDDLAAELDDTRARVAELEATVDRLETALRAASGVMSVLG